MHFALIIYGSLDTMSGGYLYDRKLVAYLRSRGDIVEIISLPWRNYPSHLTDNFSFRLPSGFDILIQDELNHPSLLAANHQTHPCPVISLVHNLRSSENRPAWQNRLYRLVEKNYLRSVDGFIFNSQTTLDTVRPLAGADRPYVIATPGGDRLGSLPADVIQARALEPGPLRLLFLANVTPLKGLDVLLKALTQLASPFSLDVIGSLDVDKTFSSAMQRYAQANGLSPHVNFLGVLDGEQLLARIRRAQVLVIPSRYEGFGIAYLEGMAFGLPAIGTRRGAIPRLITDAENGFLIEPDDADTLALRLNELSSDRPRLLDMSLKALAHFRSQPTWDQMGEMIRSFLLSQIRPARPVTAQQP